MCQPCDLMCHPRRGRVEEPSDKGGGRLRTTEGGAFTRSFTWVLIGTG